MSEKNLANPPQPKRSENAASFVRENLRIFKVLLLAFSFSFSFSFVNITTIQLVQDKYCLNQLKLSAELCKGVQKDESLQKQSIEIYQAATTFVGHQSLIFFFPGIFVSLFLGRWLDKYPHHMKYAFSGPLLGMSLVNLLYAYSAIEMQSDYRNMLLAALPFGSLGGLAAFFSAAYSYVTKASSERHRTICFGLLEFSVLFGSSPSVSLGGLVLDSKPWFYDNLHNYVGVFLLTSCFALSSASFALFGVDYTPKNEEEKAAVQNAKAERSHVFEKIGSSSRSGKKSPIREIFSISNVLGTFRQIFVRRERRAHIRLWLLMPCLVVALVIILGEMFVAFQFAEKAYHWDALHYSYLKTVTSLLYAGGVLALPFIFQKYFKYSDSTLALIGTTSLIVACIVRGGFPVSTAFFVSEAIHTFSGLCAPSIRGLISKIVDPNEVSQVFTAMACLESLAPIGASLLFTFTFNQTIETYPGFAYHLMATMMFYPLLVIVYTNLYGLKDKAKSDSKIAFKSGDFSVTIEAEREELKLKNSDH